MESAGCLRMLTLARVAGSTRAYVGPWNTFVLMCGSLMRPRRPLPVDDMLTIALYFQSLMDKANVLSTLKSASASIAFFHKINLFANHPTIHGSESMYGENRGRKKVLLVI